MALRGSHAGRIRAVVDLDDAHPAGLRERKKAMTRRLLIDAAVDLCLKQGYENTTVEQIADAVEVSPRTFSRYFTSKDAAFIAVVDDLAEEIATELNAQQPDVGPMEALRAAHMAVLTRVAERRPVAGLTAERIVLILRVVYSSATLRQAAIEYRSPAALEALGRLMRVSPDDQRLELAVALVLDDDRQGVSGRRCQRSRPAAGPRLGEGTARASARRRGRVHLRAPIALRRGYFRLRTPMVAMAMPTSAVIGPMTDHVVVLDIGLPPRTPKPCSAQSTPKHATMTPTPMRTMRIC
jgi:AcrR family transcriptional regulator